MISFLLIELKLYWFNLVNRYREWTDKRILIGETIWVEIERNY